MSDLRDLYQEVILDHNRSPRNFGEPDHCDRKADGHNPLCGDEIRVFVTFEDGVVKDVRFVGNGCAISMASASMMTDLIKGKTESEARDLFSRFHQIVTGQVEGEPAADGEDDDADHLAVLSGVREYPMRVKCATLAWHTLVAALDGGDQPVVTE